MAASPMRLLADALLHLRQFLTENAGPMYGPFPGGDPRLFTPDFEECTPEEITRWRAACAEWDAGKGKDDGPGCGTVRVDGDKVAHILAPSFGFGVWQGPEDPDLADLVREIEECLRADGVVAEGGAE